MSMVQEFVPGDRVVVKEGLPGVVTHEAVGIDFTHYYVVLDGGQGYGWWGENEMTLVSGVGATTASRKAVLEAARAQATDSYPELGNILIERPDYELAIPEAEHLSRVLMGRTASVQREALYLPLNIKTERSSAYSAGFSDGQAGVKDASRGETIYTSEYLLGWSDGLMAARAPQEPYYTEDMAVTKSMTPDTMGSDLTLASRSEGAWQDVRDFITGDPTPTDYWKGPGRNPSHDACRFRRDSHCWLPRHLNRQASDIAGYAVWVPEDRGHCKRVSWSDQEACVLYEPGPNVGGFTDATVAWEDGGQRGGYPGERIASLAQPEEQDSDGWRFHYTAAWADVQAKGKRIFDDGKVRVLSVIMADEIRPEIFVAQVEGDTKVYEVELNFVPGTFKVGAWSCTCPWNTYNWGRRVRPEWEGRACSHFMAALYAMQSQGMSGMPDIEDEVAPEWVPKSASTGSVMGHLLERSQRLSEKVATKGTFRGKVNDRVVDLDFDGGVVSLNGQPFDGEVLHPRYDRFLGLVASRKDTDVNDPIVTPTHLGWLAEASEAVLLPEPEPALPVTYGDEVDGPQPAIAEPPVGVTEEEVPMEDLGFYGEDLQAQGNRYEPHVIFEEDRVRILDMAGSPIAPPFKVEKHWGEDQWSFVQFAATEAEALEIAEQHRSASKTSSTTKTAAFWVVDPEDGHDVDGPFETREQAERESVWQRGDYGDGDYVIEERSDGDKKTASVKTAAAFSPLHVDSILSEGEGTQARNLDRLDLTGTHYQALEPLLETPGLDDDTISW